uniref:Uncharacterized protein n=1 Tax=Globodera rostochiensis TaxID=31243 RepID=A0A914HT14_GLORO
MLLNLKCIVLPLLALFTVNTVLSAWTAENWATKDGTSSGTASTIGTFEHQQHHRRWRRGSGFPSLGSLGRGALRSKSGQRVAHDIFQTDEIETSWFQNFKRSLKPTSRLTHDEAVKMVRAHKLRFAFGVVFAQNVEQLHQLKELLKATFYFEQILTLFSNEKVKQEANLQNAKDVLKQSKKSVKKSAEEKKKKGKGSKSEEHQQPKQQNTRIMDKALVEKLQKRVDKLTKTKRIIKEIISKFDTYESKKDFDFAYSIYKWEGLRPDVELGVVLNNWEKKKPNEWGKNDLKIWMKNNTKSKRNAHDLHTFAIGQTDITTKNLVNQILLLDAALDREARNLCLNTAFVVPMRNWAEISQEMTDEQIEKYVTNVLGDNFLGLQITFDSGTESTFDESVDFEEIDETKKRGLKDFWHKVRTAVLPYSSRGPKTHLKQLEAKNTKLSWDILKAMNREDRITAKESVKLAVYLMMTIEKAYSDDVKAKIEEAKKQVYSQKQEVKKAKKEHKRAHSRHNSPEHKMSRSQSVRSSRGRRRRKRDDTDDDVNADEHLEGDESGPSDGDDGNDGDDGDDGDNGDDGSGHSDGEYEPSDGDGAYGSEHSEKCATKQKVNESRAMLAKSKSQRDELLKSQKAVKKSRESLYKLQKSKSGRDGFDTYFESIKTKAKGNEIYEQINGEILENAKQQLQLQDGQAKKQVEALVEKHMREVFAEGPGKQFLLNMIELSKQMTAFEIRQCAEKFSWFPGCKVQINDGQITHNGTGEYTEDDEPKKPRGLSRSASAASTSSTQRRADGLKSKSTRSAGKRDHKRR